MLKDKKIKKLKKKEKEKEHNGKENIVNKRRLT